MTTFALSLAFWIFLWASSVALFPVALAVWALTAPFDRRKVILHRFTCFWASLYTWLNPAWRVTIEGRSKIDPQQPVVFVSNHLSSLDILVLFRLFTHFKWVSKIENFRPPFIGWNMSLNGYIPVVRGDKQSVVRMMGRCRQALEGGSSIMMFPEGTRSPTGRLRDFRSGAFVIAQDAGVPLQPLVITGSSDALPKSGLVITGKHRIHVRVLDVVPPEAFGDRSSEELAAWVRERIAAELPTETT